MTIYRNSFAPYVIESPLGHLVTTRDLPFFTTGLPPIGWIAPSNTTAAIDVPELGAAFGTGVYYSLSHASGVPSISSSYANSVPVESYHKILRYRADWLSTLPNWNTPDPPPEDWEGVLHVLLSDTAHPQASLTTINSWLEDADIPITVEEEEFAEEELDYSDILYPYEAAGGRSWAEVEVEQLVRRKNQTITGKTPSAYFHGVLWDQVEDQPALPIVLPTNSHLYLPKTIETVTSGTYTWTQQNSEAGGLLLPNATPINRQTRYRRFLSGGDPLITLSGMGFTSSDVVYDYSSLLRVLQSIVGETYTMRLTVEDDTLGSTTTPVNEDLDEMTVAVTIDQIEDRNRFVIVLLHSGCLAFNLLSSDPIKNMNDYLARLIEYSTE